LKAPGSLFPFQGKAGVAVVLKVREAHASDVDKGIARIDPRDMAFYGLSEGEVVLIEGNRPYPVRLLHCEVDDRGESVILIDRITRENLEVGIDGKVDLIKANWEKAASVTVSQIAGDAAGPGPDIPSPLISFLYDRPLLRGGRIRAKALGTTPCEFLVKKTVPGGVVVVGMDTKIKVENETEGKTLTRKSGVSYEDIGGLGPQIKRIREMVEIPLRFPEVFRKLGIEPPKGILLFGPPGSGKTALARAVANETDAFFSSISGPEIIGKYYGESEARLRSVFEEASKNAPAILFIDEIDAIAPKREEMGGEKQVERRVVAQLLALMDGLESRGKIVVMAATNIPNALDPALRRPGRFDREILVPVPNRQGRLEILQIHTRGMPLAKEIDLAGIAARTHGFVGADLEALAKEAAMNALRRLLPSMDLEKGELAGDALERLQVTLLDFELAMKEVEPSALREVTLEVPEVGWDDIGGLRAVKETLRQAVEWPLWNEELYRQMDARPPRGILLHGRAGSGKSLLVKALARETGLNFIFVPGPSLLSRFIGEGEKELRQAFRLARQSSPSILCLDGIDSLFPLQAGAEKDGVAERLIAQFCSEMSGIADMRGVTVIGTALDPGKLDSRVRGAGRFEIEIGLEDPNEAERLEILTVQTKRKPLSSNIRLDEIAAKTAGLNGAELENLCRVAAEEAIKEQLMVSEKERLAQIGPMHFKIAAGKVVRNRYNETEAPSRGQSEGASLDEETVEPGAQGFSG
jgi:transitional endoplasmic reticulum ATPase